MLSTPAHSPSLSSRLIVPGLSVQLPPAPRCCSDAYFMQSLIIKWELAPLLHPGTVGQHQAHSPTAGPTTPHSSVEAGGGGAGPGGSRKAALPILGEIVSRGAGRGEALRTFLFLKCCRARKPLHAAWNRVMFLLVCVSRCSSSLASEPARKNTWRGERSEMPASLPCHINGNGVLSLYAQPRGPHPSVGGPAWGFCSPRNGVGGAHSAALVPCARLCPVHREQGCPCRAHTRLRPM